MTSKDIAEKIWDLWGDYYRDGDKTADETLIETEKIIETLLANPVVTSRALFMRKEANSIFELTKGYTPEQRANFNNAMKSMEEMAGYVLELTAYLDGMNNKDSSSNP